MSDVTVNIVEETPIQIAVTDETPIALELAPEKDEIQLAIDQRPIEVNITDEIPIGIELMATGPSGIQGPQGLTGPAGPQGAPGINGQGVPTGGTVGQVLTKDTSADYDTSWVDPTGGDIFTSDTRANILASNPSVGTYAISTDTDELFFYNGTNWKVHPIKVATELANPDAGYTQDSDKRGYGDDYIYGKKMYAMGLGDFTEVPYEGAIKVDRGINPPKYQIYLRGKWNTLFYDLNMDNGDFEHVPQTYSIDLRSGNSNITGLNGQPIIREYKLDAGAYPRPTIIDGGLL